MAVLWVEARCRVVREHVRKVEWFEDSRFSSVHVLARVARVAAVPADAHNLAAVPANSAVARTPPVLTGWDTRPAPGWAQVREELLRGPPNPRDAQEHQHAVRVSVIPRGQKKAL